MGTATKALRWTSAVASAVLVWACGGDGDAPNSGAGDGGEGGRTEGGDVAMDPTDGEPYGGEGGAGDSNAEKDAGIADRSVEADSGADASLDAGSPVQLDAGVDAVDATADSSGDTTAPVLARLDLVPNPRSVLSFTALFDTNEPARTEVKITDDSSGRSFTVHGEEAPGTSHSVEIVCLRAQRTYTVEVTATDPAGNSASVSRSFTTDPLPTAFPSLRVRTSNPARMAPGYTLFGIKTFTLGTPWFLVAVDEAGDVCWYYEGAGGPFHRMQNGNFATITSLSTMIEVDVMGRLVDEWDATTLPVINFHHAVVPFGNDHRLMLGSDLRTIDGYPDGGSYPLRGDAVHEYSGDGSVVGTWSLFEVLDPYRTPPMFFNVNLFGHDWTHANSIFYDTTDDTLVVSSRTQSQVVKMTRNDPPEKVWILGEDGDFVLTGGEWFYNQHAAEITLDGRVILYDNGNERPGGPWSRAVEYEIDTTSWTARQVWEFRDVTPFYSRQVCDADRLSNGNVLVADVGRMSNPDLDAWDPQNRKWMRILEVTHTASPEIVFEIAADEPLAAGFSGYLGYEAERIPSIYPPSVRIDGQP